MKEKEEKAPEKVEKEMAEKDMHLEAKEVMRKEGIKVVYRVGETWFKREKDAKNCAKKRKGKVEKYEA